MPSPFPGMDPYFERARFKELHTKLLDRVQDHLNRILPPPYRVDLETQVIIREPSADERHALRIADLSISGAAGGGVATTTNVVTRTSVYEAISTDVDQEKHRWLTVRRRDDEAKIVTHLELLSPSNKRQDRTAYVAKRAELMRSDAHFVEIDLLRGGGRMPMEGVPPSDYYALVARAGGWPKSTVWTFGLHDRMPTIPIPLAGDDPDVPLDLQAAFERLYDDASYGRDPSLHGGPVEPALSEADAAWAETLISRR